MYYGVDNNLCHGIWPSLHFVRRAVSSKKWLVFTHGRRLAKSKQIQVRHGSSINNYFKQHSVTLKYLHECLSLLEYSVLLVQNVRSVTNCFMYPNHSTIVSNLWSICRNAASLSPVCRKLLRIVASFISRQYARQCQKLVCPSIVLLSKNQLWTFMDFGDRLYGIQRVWKVDTQEPIRPV